MDASLDHFGVLQIEPTDVCNLSCSMCAPHHDGWEQIHGVPKGRMDLDVYRGIVQGLADEDCRFDHVIFQWLGDPSLHPQLEDMVGLAAEHLGARVGYLRVDTNAIVLTPARMDRLLDLAERWPQVPLLLVFTIDAVTPETYLRVKGQDALLRVRRNVRHLLRRRAQRGVAVNVELQFVLQEGNAHEAGAFIQYWSDFLECQGGSAGHTDIMIKRLSVGAGGPGQLEADELYERTVRSQGIRAEVREHIEVKVWEARPWESTASTDGARQPCPGLWMTPVIRHDGHLMMCCADLGGDLDLGSLEESSFRELWEGPVALQRRVDHIQGRFEGVCADCGGINWYTTTDEVIEDTLRRAAK
ncbi:MAG: radical SAM protein [Proteobacteria bacterium]|nr:radical SAM protein [Pseudomonadota bacterium]MCP4917589.1 radical SAM protein [Pseudomonadota bacterium]